MIIVLVGCNQESEEPINQDDQLSTLAGNFIDQLSLANYEAAVEFFDETMATEIPAETLNLLWQQLTTEMGDFDHYTVTEITEMDGYNVVLLDGHFEDGQVTFVISFDQQSLIAGFYIH